MICWERVNELRDEIGQGDFAEVVEIFFEEVEEVIEKLRLTPDPNTYEADFHFLKGSALNLGFNQFADLCGTGEKAASNQQTDNINMVTVFETYRQSKHEFNVGQP